MVPDRISSSLECWVPVQTTILVSSKLHKQAIEEVLINFFFNSWHCQWFWLNLVMFSGPLVGELSSLLCLSDHSMGSVLHAAPSLTQPPLTPFYSQLPPVTMKNAARWQGSPKWDRHTESPFPAYVKLLFFLSLRLMFPLLHFTLKQRGARSWKTALLQELLYQ